MWNGVNTAAYVVIVAGGVALESLASNTTRMLTGRHQTVAVVLVAVIGAGFPLLGFLIYGVRMLWVTDPKATTMTGRPQAHHGRHRSAEPDIPNRDRTPRGTT